MILTKHNGQLVRVTPIDQLNFDNFRPIGSLYFQFPGCDDPNTLFPNSTWTNISPTYWGDFMRTLGPGANGTSMPSACFSKYSCIGCYYQGFQTDLSKLCAVGSGWVCFARHCHCTWPFTPNLWTDQSDIVDTYAIVTNTKDTAQAESECFVNLRDWAQTNCSKQCLVRHCTGNANMSVTVCTWYTPSSSAPETRPYNYTIRVWQRTA